MATLPLPPEIDLLYRHGATRDVVLRLPEHLAEYVEKHPDEIRQAVSSAELIRRRKDVDRLRSTAARRGLRPTAQQRARVRDALAQLSRAPGDGGLHVLVLGDEAAQ